MSLFLCMEPLCFPKTTFVLVPKKSIASCLNDYIFIALTSVVMKCLEKLVMSFIQCNISATLDPLQFDL